MGLEAGTVYQQDDVWGRRGSEHGPTSMPGMQGSCQEGQRRGEGHIGYPDGVRLFTLWGEGWIWRVDMKVISLEMVMEAMGVNEIP